MSLIQALIDANASDHDAAEVLAFDAFLRYPQCTLLPFHMVEKCGLPTVILWVKDESAPGRMRRFRPETDITPPEGDG